MHMLRRILPAPVKALLRSVYRFVIWWPKAAFGGAMGILNLALGRRRLLSLIHYFGADLKKTLVIDGITFDASHPIPHRRAVTMLTKEPDTIAWVDDFMKAEDVFYDVGANIGVFSLYAAARKKVTVLAFEPLASNYSILNENIHLNDLSGSITALSIAMHDTTTLSALNVSEMRPGKAGHSFETPFGSAETLPPAFRQGMIGMRMDEFIERFEAPFPNHVKIDVDGNEPQVIEGMGEILSDVRLKSIAVELDSDRPDHMALIDKITGFGFEPLEDERYVNQVYKALRPVYNHFFIRS